MNLSTVENFYDIIDKILHQIKMSYEVVAIRWQ